MQINNDNINFKTTNKKGYLITQFDLNEDILAVQGWNTINNEWFYFQKDGALAVNTNIDGYAVGYDGKLI